MDTVQPGGPNSDRPGASKPGAPHLSAPDLSEHMRPPLRTPSRRRRVLWFLVILILCVVLLGGFWGFVQFKQKMIVQYFATATQPPTAVEVYKAATQSMPRRFESIGTLTAVHQVTIAPQVSGRVTAIKFESGLSVKAGDVLVQLDDATERADIATYQAQARLATANLGRQQKLAQNQFSTKASIDDLKRFHGLKLVAPTLVFTLEKMGWIRGEGMDGGGFDEHSKQFPAADVTAVVQYEGNVGMGYIDPDELLTLESIHFCPGMRPPSGYGWGSKKKLKLKDVNPIVFSEVVADLQVLKSKAK